MLGDEDASTILAAGSVDELMTRLEQQPYMDTAEEERSHALPHFQGWSQRNAPYPNVARTALTEAEKKQALLNPLCTARCFRLAWLVT